MGHIRRQQRGRRGAQIRNSHVEAKGTSGSICDISGLKLEGSYIYSPSNAAYDADTKSVAVNGVTVKEKL